MLHGDTVSIGYQEKYPPSPSPPKDQEKTHHPALYVWLEETGEKLQSVGQAHQIEEAVGRSQEELARWRAVIKAGIARGWKTKNITWALDHYADPESYLVRPQASGQDNGTLDPEVQTGPMIVVGLSDEVPDWLGGPLDG